MAFKDGSKFRPYAPDQSYLLPPSPKDWLPAGHLAFFISDTVDQLDLTGFLKGYSPDIRGEKGYHPAMLLKVHMYGYCTGVFSSRQIKKRMVEDVAFRMLAAGNEPSHRSIRRFRQENLPEFVKLFVKVVEIAQEAGLVKGALLAVDGTKVKANASKHKAMSYERMCEEEKRLKEEIAELLADAEEIDEEEDLEFGPDICGDEVAEDLKDDKKRLEKIRAAKRRIEERQRQKDAENGRHPDDTDGTSGKREPTRKFGQPAPKAQDNFTDPQSRIMKTSSGGFDQCYNAQIAVDSKADIIVANDVSQCAADSGQLLPMVKQVEKNTGEVPEKVLADAGYRAEGEFRKLEKKGVVALVSLGREGKPAPESELPATKRMAHRLSTKRGKDLYKKRKGIVEPMFGLIKRVLGFRQFLLRGHAKVKAEWALVCTALNLRRMSTRMVWV